MARTGTRHTDAVATGVPGLVERQARGGEGAFVVERARLAGAHTEGHRHPDAGCRLGSDRAAQILGNPRGLVGIATRQDDQELLTPEAVGEIERAQALAQLVGDIAQDGVADRMTVRMSAIESSARPISSARGKARS